MNTRDGVRWLRERQLGVRETEGWSGEAFINPLSSTRVYTHRYTCDLLHILVMLFFSHPLCVYTRLWIICVWSLFRPHVRAPAFNAAWPYNSNVETPLTGTRILDITFTHVIPHQFLETKAANIWWREQTRCGLVDEVRASILPGPASNFLLLPFVPSFLLISRLAPVDSLLWIRLNVMNCYRVYQASCCAQFRYFKLCYLLHSFLFYI